MELTNVARLLCRNVCGGHPCGQRLEYLFSHRDKGFDFIITKPVGEEIIVRPVQVKGKYPKVEGRNLPAYGFVGRLTQLHDDMVLAIACFSTNIHSVAPDHVGVHAAKSNTSPAQVRPLLHACL